MSHDAPIQSYRLIRKFIPCSLQPLARGIRKRFFDTGRPVEEPYRTVSPYTQAHLLRQKNLVRLAQEIEANCIPGAIIECGVLDGGTAALMAAHSDREIHLFNSWAGLPNTTDKDGEAAKVWAGDVFGSQARVKSIMRQLNVDLSRVHFYRGWFDQTFPSADIPDVALVHIDADFYKSVRLSIFTWFPKLSPGGYMQFDDYGSFVGCTRAVDEFIENSKTLQLRCRDNIVFYIEK